MAASTNAEARFNAPATGGKEHRSIRVERAVFARLSRFRKRTWFRPAIGLQRHQIGGFALIVQPKIQTWQGKKDL